MRRIVITVAVILKIRINKFLHNSSVNKTLYDLLIALRYVAAPKLPHSLGITLSALRKCSCKFTVNNIGVLLVSQSLGKQRLERQIPKHRFQLLRRQCIHLGGKHHLALRELPRAAADTRNIAQRTLLG